MYSTVARRQTTPKAQLAPALRGTHRCYPEPCMQAAGAAGRIYRAPLLPRMKASPYFALSTPFWYSSVCSIAMFM